MMRERTIFVVECDGCGAKAYDRGLPLSFRGYFASTEEAETAAVEAGYQSSVRDDVTCWHCPACRCIGRAIEALERAAVALDEPKGEGAI